MAYADEAINNTKTIQYLFVGLMDGIDTQTAAKVFRPIYIPLVTISLKMDS